MMPLCSWAVPSVGEMLSVDWIVKLTGSDPYLSWSASVVAVV